MRRDEKLEIRVSGYCEGARPLFNRGEKKGGYERRVARHLIDPGTKFYALTDPWP